MTRVALLALVMITGAASAQQRTFYDASGKVVGRSSTGGKARSRTTMPRPGHQPRDTAAPDIEIVSRNRNRSIMNSRSMGSFVSRRGDRVSLPA